MVDAQTTRKTHSTLQVIALLQPLVAGQSTHRVFDALRNLRQGLARLNVLLCILADLAVDLSTLTVLLKKVIVHAIEIPLLLIRGPVGIVVFVFDDLALGVLVVGEEVGNGDPRWRALDLGATLLLLLRLALLLLFGSYRAIVLAAFPSVDSCARG